MAGEDFVQVRLTEAGRELCGEGTYRVIRGHHDFEFRRDEIQRVTKAFDWHKVLATEIRDGKPMFEIVEPTAEQPSAKAAKKKELTYSEESNS